MEQAQKETSVTTDCLIVGFYDPDFQEYEQLIRTMGENTGAYRNLTWGMVQSEGRLYRCLDLLTRYHYEGRPAPARPFNNADYLWLCVTYLSTYLNKHGHSTDYVSLPHFEKEQFREKLLAGNIRTIAITTTLYVAPHPILDLVAFIRRYNREVKIVIGGPYISSQAKTLTPEELSDQFKLLGGDFYVIGAEGEHAFACLLDVICNGGDLASVENIAYREGDRFVLTRESQESNPLEENMIEWSRFPKADIGEFLTLRTAKSCPFACSFCGFPQRAGAYKYLPVELVEKDLNAINDLGTVTTVAFIDDTFNVPKTRFKELMRMMIRNKYDFKWNCYYRSDHGDDEAIALMAEAGCEGVLLGIESGSDRMLKNMNKTARRKDYERSIPLLQKSGISCYASLIIGFPGETLETVQETIDLIEQTKPDFYRPQIWYFDPITPIADRRDEFGIKGWGFSWSHNTMDVDTACDLIERTLLSVKNSVWLPEHGFEQWSTFYLKRKGMTIPQVQRYADAFNTAIKERLLAPGHKEASPEILETIRLCAQFDRPVAPDLGPVERLAGGRYLDAEAFWFGEFGSGPTSSNLQVLADRAESADEPWESHPVGLDRKDLDAACSGCGAQPRDLLLGAFSALLSRLSGLGEAIVVTASTDESGSVQSFPLRLVATDDTRFGDHVRTVAEKWSGSAPHAIYSWNILTNPIRMGFAGTVPPVLDVAFVHLEPSDGDGFGLLGRALEGHPRVYESLRLVLEVMGEGPALRFNLVSRLGGDLTRALVACLTRTVEWAARNPDGRLVDLSLLDAETRIPTERASVLKYQTEEFEF
jgi:radical SAM PhpK family P-methyltransferase